MNIPPHNFHLFLPPTRLTQFSASNVIQKVHAGKSKVYYVVEFTRNARQQKEKKLRFIQQDRRDELSWQSREISAFPSPTSTDTADECEEQTERKTEKKRASDDKTFYEILIDFLCAMLLLRNNTANGIDRR